jgi:uncharacterized protein (UPF0261 family)
MLAQDNEPEEILNASILNASILNASILNAPILNAPKSPAVAVLATMNTKAPEAYFVAGVLSGLGVKPCIIDISMRPHDISAEVSGGQIAEAAGTSWPALSELTRHGAAAAMVKGGTRILLEKAAAGEISGAIGLGGANGTDLVCSILRALPYLFPKVVISAVAGTAAVQWWVAESDIAMYPSIGDISMNRLTEGVMENAACAVAAAARNWASRRELQPAHASLLAVSSFGGTAGCVDRVRERLEALGYEVILCHASGGGGKSLERLAAAGELAGVIDVTTHELTDLLVGGVYSAGDQRLTSAGAAGLPQVIVPGAIDHGNFWAAEVPECYRHREFFRYNAQNILMRTNAEEFRKLGRLIAERVNAAKGPVRVLIPLGGFSEHTHHRAQDLAGNDNGPWLCPGEYQAFTAALQSSMNRDLIQELPLHINEPAFGDACVEAYVEMSQACSAK